MGKFIDLTGDVFGLLSVIGFSHSDGKHTYWKCKCDCSAEVIVRSNNLRTGNTSSCNDNIHRIGNGLNDITGQTFGDLLVIGINRNTKWEGERTFWDCVCVCGKHTTVESGNLKSGHTKSCGCLLDKAITTHGCAKKDRRLYNIWLGIKDRCYNPKNIGYKNYGNRNITVCEDWFCVSAFFEWAYSSGYIYPLTIERINVNDGYNPENCTWIPMSQQNSNKRNSIKKQKFNLIKTALSCGLTPKEVSLKYNTPYSTVISIKNRH